MNRTGVETPRPRREELKPGECLCDLCTGRCCRYFSLPIDNPTTWDDYDSIRWYLAHGRTLIYVEKEQWYLLVMTRCTVPDGRRPLRHLLESPQDLPRIHDRQLRIRRRWSFDKVFETPEQIWEYAEAVLPPRRTPRRKSTAARSRSSRFLEMSVVSGRWSVVGCRIARRRRRNASEMAVDSPAPIGDEKAVDELRARDNGRSRTTDH